MKIGKQVTGLINQFKIVLISTLIYSCKQSGTPDEAAQRFCNCMKKNGSPTNYDYAYKICNHELMQSNRMYKLFRLDVGPGYLEQKVKPTYETMDTVYKYMAIFENYEREHCCKVTLRCEEDSIIRHNR
jgi:hypothetical protein